MIKQIKYKNITWIDVHAPTKEEVDSLSKEYDIHTIVHTELMHPSPRSKVDLYDNFIYLILHFPSEHFFKAEDDDEDGTKEIDFVLGKDFIITTHYENVQPLEDFSNILQAGEHVKNKKEKDAHAGYLFYYIIRELYQSLEPGLDYINNNLKRVERKIFSGHEKEMVRTLSNMNRSLLDLKWALKGHREVLNSLEIAAKEFYGDRFGYHLKTIVSEYEKVFGILENNEENFQQLRNTNESMLSIQSNEIMKTITIMAYVFLPVTLIGTIFGMSGIDTNMPIIKSDWGFFIVLCIMAVTSILMILVVKFKKWL